MKNLNEVLIPNADGPDVRLTDPSVKSGNVTCYFRNIKAALLSHLEKAEGVVGCVAWLTDKDVLRSLAKRRAAIIVQKEDFLRPDTNKVKKPELQRLYGNVAGGFERMDFPPPLHMASCAGDPTIGGIRCLGSHNSQRRMAAPRAHHKFVVFGSMQPVPGVPRDEMGCDVFTARSVWTGSFNFTNNGGNSLENAVLIEDPAIAHAYLLEFCQLAIISEPLDWESEWVEPQWRIGT